MSLIEYSGNQELPIKITPVRLPVTNAARVVKDAKKHLMLIESKITQAKIIKWIESLPTKQQIEAEAELPQGYLTKCAKGEKNMKLATILRVVKVIKKYGFN